MDHRTAPNVRETLTLLVYQSSSFLCESGRCDLERELSSYSAYEYFTLF